MPPQRKKPRGKIILTEQKGGHRTHHHHHSAVNDEMRESPESMLREHGKEKENGLTPGRSVCTHFLTARIEFAFEEKQVTQVPSHSHPISRQHVSHIVLCDTVA